MRDLIRRQDAIDKFAHLDMQVYEGSTCVGTRTCLTKEEIIYAIADIPSAELDNQVHLCDFCKYGYPECPAEISDIIFGNGIGHDNVCTCAKFEIKPERKKGEWMSHYDYYQKHELLPTGLVAFWWCDQCEEGVEHRTNFCPNCGADMRGDR